MSVLELPHEKHNRVAFELGSRIIEEFPSLEERIVLLSTIAKGIICLVAHSPTKRSKVAAMLADEIKERLDEEMAAGSSDETALDITEEYPIQMHMKNGDLVFRIDRQGRVEFGKAYNGDSHSRQFVEQLAQMVGNKFGAAA